MRNYLARAQCPTFGSEPGTELGQSQCPAGAGARPITWPGRRPASRGCTRLFFLRFGRLGDLLPAIQHEAIVLKRRGDVADLVGRPGLDVLVAFLSRRRLLLLRRRVAFRVPPDRRLQSARRELIQRALVDIVAEGLIGKVIRTAADESGPLGSRFRRKGAAHANGMAHPNGV